MLEIKTQDIEFIGRAMAFSNDDIEAGDVVDITEDMARLGNQRNVYVTTSSLSWLQRECELTSFQAKEGMVLLCAKTLQEVAEYAQSRGGKIDRSIFFYKTDWDETRPQWAAIAFCWNEDTNQIVIVFGFDHDMRMNGFIPENAEVD